MRVMAMLEVLAARVRKGMTAVEGLVLVAKVYWWLYLTQAVVAGVVVDVAAAVAAVRVDV